MYQDYKELLSAFNAHGVKYLVVGGYAVSFYAEPRALPQIYLQHTLNVEIGITTSSLSS